MPTKAEILDQQIQEDVASNAKKIFHYFVGKEFSDEEALKLATIPMDFTDLEQYYDWFVEHETGGRKGFLRFMEKMLDKIERKRM